jgi:hypothetical protein
MNTHTLQLSFSSNFIKIANFILKNSANCMRCSDAWIPDDWDFNVMIYKLLK